MTNKALRCRYSCDMNHIFFDQKCNDVDSFRLDRQKKYKFIADCIVVKEKTGADTVKLYCDCISSEIRMSI